MSSEFAGFSRSDGSVGTRNHVLILPGGWECQQIVNMVKGTVTPNSPDLGIARIRSDREAITRMQTGLALNPNVYGVIVVAGLGGVNDQVLCGQLAAAACREAGKPFEIIEHDGRQAIAHGGQLAARMVHAASALQRIRVPASALTVGVKCGGSDPRPRVSPEIPPWVGCSTAWWRRAAPPCSPKRPN